LILKAMALIANKTTWVKFYTPRLFYELAPFSSAYVFLYLPLKNRTQVNLWPKGNELALTIQ